MSKSDELIIFHKKVCKSLYVEYEDIDYVNCNGDYFYNNATMNHFITLTLELAKLDGFEEAEDFNDDESELYIFYCRLAIVCIKDPNLQFINRVCVCMKCEHCTLCEKNLIKYEKSVLNIPQIKDPMYE